LQLRIKHEDGSVVAYILKGTNAARIVGPNGAGVGYGLTDGIPTEFMTEWLKRNAKHPAVANGSIFMHTSEKGAMARAREGREIRTGIEPIDPMQDAQARGLTVDKEAEASYRRQIAENPMRNRQIVEA
jgi:hypothetical protein